MIHRPRLWDVISVRVRWAVRALLVLAFTLPVSAQSQESTTLPAPGFDLNDMRVKVQTKATDMNIRRRASPREMDADRRGIQYMQKAGYDPKALVTFLERMRAKDETELHNVLAMFQTHPPTAERIRSIQEAITSSEPLTNSHLDTTAELQQIKALLIRNESLNGEKE